MTDTKKILLSWSSGKDSAWSLHVLRQDPAVEVVGLVTTVNEEYERVAMHGVREELLRAQARAVGLPLQRIPLPEPCTNEEYEARFLAAMDREQIGDVAGMAFGDLYLEDVRDYRERLMSSTGLETLYPLWGRDTRELAQEMVAAGARAVLTCIDPKQLPREFAGRTYDAEFLRDLPEGVDPCGENGEFHSFTYAGPAFHEEIPVETGETVERGGFVFTELLPRDD